MAGRGRSRKMEIHGFRQDFSNVGTDIDGVVDGIDDSIETELKGAILSLRSSLKMIRKQEEVRQYFSHFLKASQQCQLEVREG
uniref:Uncharacterized protein n=1 Tax=Cannabis sativa TaxID=3483 RepID=A0A803NLD7_CANSA